MSLKPQMFVISALQHDPSRPGSDVETVYLGVDSNSGGYPYWSSSLCSAKFFKERPNVEEYLKGCSYIYRDIGMIHVYEVVLEAV